MRKAFLGFVVTSVAVTFACTRRPVQADIPPQNTMARSNSEHSVMTSSPGAAEAPYELQFIDTMIAHHEAAIDAAQLAPTRAGRPELKELAASMIRTQQQEITQMREWRKEWYGNHAPAINMELHGMQEGMMGMDPAKLDPLKENAFDLEFIRQMIPHHQGAVTMSYDLLAKEVKPELKTFAENIVREQEGEIEQMQAWQKQWSK